MPIPGPFLAHSSPIHGHAPALIHSQRLKNVFSVLVDYCLFSEAFLIIDRIHNPSAMAELMIEVSLRAAGGTPPVVLVSDSRSRLERANLMLMQLIKCGFLVDQVIATDWLPLSTTDCH